MSKRKKTVCLLLGVVCLFTVVSSTKAQTLWLGGRQALEAPAIVTKDRSIPIQFTAPTVPNDPLAPATLFVTQTGVTYPSPAENDYWRRAGGIAVNRPWNIYWIMSPSTTNNWSYFYGQWVFVCGTQVPFPADLTQATFYLSDPFRIAISNSH